MVYLLGDALTRIKLAQKQFRASVRVRYSRLIVDSLRIMYLQGVIRGFSIVTDRFGGNIIVYLKYIDGLPVVKDLRLVSKPGSRKYLSLGEFFRRYFKSSQQGFFVISTPYGLISSVDLFVDVKLKKNVAGEVLLQVIY